MPKKLIIVILLLTGAMLACNLTGGATGDPPEEYVTSTAPPDPTTDPGGQAPDTDPADPADTSNVTPATHFTSLSFIDNGNVNDVKYETLFPQGTKEIFAVWNYEGMEPGMTVRRVWITDDGEVWADRTEDWDFDTYGESGTMTGVSIFDFESNNGLPPRIFTVELYVDGVLQLVGPFQSPNAYFSLKPRFNPNAYSPDGSIIARFAPPRTLEVASANGGVSTLWTDRQVEDFEWFSDGIHLLVVEVVPDPNNPAPFASTWNLWVVNTQSGESYKLNKEDERLREPSISSDGRFIALSEGSGYGDACGIDSRFVLMPLDQNLVRTGTLYWDDFTNSLPPGDNVQPAIPYNGGDAVFEWLDESNLSVLFIWPCDERGIEGYYTMTMGETTAVKTADWTP